MSKTQRQPIDGDFFVEALALNELDPSARKRVENQLGETQAQVLSQVNQSNEAILARYPATIQAEQIQQRLNQVGQNDRTARFSIGRFFLWASAPLAAVLLLFWVDRPASSPIQTGPSLSQPMPAMTHVPRVPEPTRRKGSGAGIELYRRVGDDDQVLMDGALVANGDQLQIYLHPSKSSPKTGFALLLSIDGSGAITPVWPADQNLAAPLIPSEEDQAMALPFAYQLDAAPAFERLILIRSPQPFAIDKVLAAAQQLVANGQAAQSALDLPNNLQQESLLLRKEKRE